MMFKNISIKQKQKISKILNLHKNIRFLENFKELIINKKILI
jgi:hypothetical protein